MAGDSVLIGPRKVDDDRSAEPMLPSCFHGSPDREHKDVRLHDSLDGAAIAEPLADVEHSVGVSDLGRLIHEGDRVQFLEGHTLHSHPAAIRQQGIAPELSRLIKGRLTGAAKLTQVSIGGSLKKFAFAYWWGVLNFAAGTIIGAGWMYLAILAALKAKGFNV